MKNIKRFISIILSLIIVLALATGCGSSKSDMSIESQGSGSENSYDLAGVSPAEDSTEEYKEDSDGKASPLEPTKVIVRFYLDMQTVDFDNSITGLEKLIAKNQAYVENSNIQLGDYYRQSDYRSAEYIIRVPKTNLNKFMNETGSIGKLNSQQESKEDVTMYYRDTESRLNLLNVKEERILELLKKADKMEDIIVLENSLSDIIYEKENIIGVLKNLDDQIDFTTVTISLREVQKIDLKDDGKISFSKRISNAFSNSLHYFKIGFENFIIQLIYLLPSMAILLFLGLGIYKGLNFYRRKGKSFKNIDKDKK